MERETQNPCHRKPPMSEEITGEMRAIFRSIWRTKQTRDAEAPPASAEPAACPQQVLRNKLAAAGYRAAAITGVFSLTPPVLHAARDIHRNRALVHLLTGPAYTGKTTVAALLSYWRCEAGRTAGHYLTAHALAQSLKASYDAGSAAAQRALARSRWLVVDDIHRGPTWVLDELENLVIERADNNLPSLLIGSTSSRHKLGDQITARAAHIEASWPTIQL